MRVWVLVGGSVLQRIMIKAPRVVYINTEVPRDEATWRSE